MSARHRTPHRTRAWWVAGVMLGLAGLLAAGYLLTHPTTAPRSGLVDMNGHPVTLDPGVSLDPSTPTPAGTTDPTAPTAAGRLVIASAGLDVPLETMREAGGTITPPGFTAAYRIAGRGVGPAHASTGTVYVAMHSLRNGGLAPGNYLFDTATGSSKVATGARIEVDGLAYAVDETTVIGKTELPETASLWANEPGRLVLITCLQKPDHTPSTANFVITAHLDTPQ